ncbi:MAG TPA: DUF4129 domain-containing protein [Candidatus Angelobacter sp.]|nr:DUF4129 domain-containing protein [Candidatus Angelobacter sp.]
MRLPRVLPYLVGLIILAFALGSLPRGTSGGSLLFQAYWLLYLVQLGPVVVLGAMVAAIVFIAMNYRDLGAGIGYQLARRGRTRKRGSRYSTILAMIFWALAFWVLINTKGSILNPSDSTSSNLVEKIAGANGTPPTPLQTSGVLLALSNLVQNGWFSLAFLGLLVVGALVLVQSFRVAVEETRDMAFRELQGNQERGLQAIHEAIRLVHGSASDPRSRIIACYQHLIATVSRLGAPVSSDLTARELERAIRSAFALKGQATTDLTQLFEEARYSLHDMSESDADKAHEFLESVAEELKIQVQTEN